MKIVVLSLCLFLFQFQSHAKIYGPKRYDYVGIVSFAGAELFLANGNFDNNGQSGSLPYSGQFMLLDIPFGARYVYGSNWGFEAELKASLAQSESSEPTNGGTRSNSQVHEMRVSTDWIYETQSMDLIPEIEVIMPFDKVDPNTDTVMVGEGAQSTTFRLHLQTEFGESDFFGHVAYEMRDEGRSDLLPWSAAMGWDSGRNFYGARLFGFQSISDDKDQSNSLARDNLIVKVNGGAAKFYGVNPSVISAEGFWLLKLSKQWEVQMHAGLDLAGENYAKGLFGGLNLVMDWGEKQQRNPRRKIIKDTNVVQPRGSGIAVDSETIDFQEETQQVDDQQYFEPPPAPRKTRTKTPSDQQLQQKMDNVEMQIELKKKKRR